jgi:single-stranded-DNA-specific exonuclease
MSMLSDRSNFWIEREDIQIPKNLAAAVGGHALVAQTLARRGIQDAGSARAFLDASFYSPADPQQLPGLAEAAVRLNNALQHDETICVWGDFDVDGQTATTLLVSALRELGDRVIYHIPVRASESHGVSLPVLKQMLALPEGERPSVLLTCDTGISAHESIAYAQQNGVTVIVTDHHDLPPTLPEASAIVNPKLLPTGHPLSTLPGVGVAYKLIEALYDHAGRSADLGTYLDLVALGIVADLAVLYADTRYLLQRGLGRLRGTKRLGLRAMLELVELDPTRLTEEHIGFVLAPRLNALGRLSDANPAVELLTTQDPARARLLSLELEGLNARRKLLTDQVYKAALAQIERDPSLMENAALVLAHPEWPAGVLGIVASRLVERTNKPVVLLSSPVGGAAHGSARSIEGVDISAALREQNELLADFGGHPMAAGLSLETQRIPEFRRALSRSVAGMLGEAPPRPPVQIDGHIELAELTMELVTDLERLAPFGPGNPLLVLTSRRLRTISQAPVGREAEHLLIRVEDERGENHQIIWWQGGSEQAPKGLFDLAYTVRSSSYRGQAEVQIEWVAARLVEDQPVEIAAWQPPEDIIDYRRERNPLAALQSWIDQPGIQIWREAKLKEQVAGLNRHELKEGDILVIWSIPPGPVELHAALHTVSPAKLILFAADPGMDKFEPFLQRMAGLVKFALNSSQGQVSVQSLAAATAQRAATVRAGLAWLLAAGHIRIVHQEEDTAWLVEGEGTPGEGLPELTRRLKSALEETAAYRAFYSRADIEAVIAV